MLLKREKYPEQETETQYLLAIIDTSFAGDVGCPARAEAGLQALQQCLQQVGRFLLLLLEIEATNASMLLLAGHAPALLAAIPRVQEHWQPPSLANLKKRKKISLWDRYYCNRSTLAYTPC